MKLESLIRGSWFRIHFRCGNFLCVYLCSFYSCKTERSNSNLQARYLGKLLFVLRLKSPAILSFSS